MIHKKQKQAEQLCKDIAYLRSGKCCEICGKPGREIHHIFFGIRWMNCWPARCNPAFFVNLCPREHKPGNDKKGDCPWAPHVNNILFLEKIAAVLWEKDPERIDEIQNFINMPPSDPGEANWDSMIRKLKKKKKYLEVTTWMDEAT